MRVVNPTGRRQHDTRSLVVVRDILLEVSSRDGLDILGGSQDGAAQSSSLVCSGVKIVENYLLKVGLYLLHFSKNDTPFTLYFLFSQGTVLNDVRKYLHSSRQVLGETFGVVDGLLAGC